MNVEATKKSMAYTCLEAYSGRFHLSDHVFGYDVETVVANFIAQNAK